MAGDEDKQAAARRRMVQEQLRARGIRDQRVLEAMALVPREKFVGPDHRHEAYEDYPVPIGQGQTVSQPYVVALMLQELDVGPTHRVLDVGAGSGYQTAMLARLAGHVYAIERIDQLRRRAQTVLDELGLSNVTLITGDGTAGWPVDTIRHRDTEMRSIVSSLCVSVSHAREAPFDRIICGAAGPEVPEAWIEQLADGGRIVMPVGGPGDQMLILVEKQGHKLRRREICGVRFVRLIGRYGWQV